MNPQAESWLDLGRAQEPQVCVASARLLRQVRPARSAISGGTDVAGMGRDARSSISKALAAFKEPKRLYREASNIEGETEVMLPSRTHAKRTVGLRAARADLERAMALARNSRSASSADSRKSSPSAG